MKHKFWTWWEIVLMYAMILYTSGYNAYFVTLKREMQLELIERAEYGT
ncbi:MAG: hypothetical protein ABSB79_08590 [Syntrophales bacterium]|jgi:hypothetical protein